ncbi:MAG TPA: tellurite resistance/C4-dicarboxylate transporter family protein [Candidatus Angelobacter sp.]|nr:tellurite resistance/C4-dicarboxylate transporter family protein [Candidatus Angelobacter sp.]
MTIRPATHTEAVSGNSQRRPAIREKLQGFPPVYFAMVMATGIVSIAEYLQGLTRIAAGLMWLNVVLYVLLWSLLLGRLVAGPKALLRELTDFSLAPSFFTIVAATGVLGREFLIIHVGSAVATALLWIAFPLWAVFIYVIFCAFTVKEEKPSLAGGIHGGWLLAVVATQSLSILVALLALWSPHHGAMLFAALGLWLCGGMLYIWIISLIFYRYTFFKFPPSDLMPPYWINMGAMAISTLAGATLIQNSALAPFLEAMLPFLKGFTVFFWATATWWIPMLVILGFWRHFSKRFPLKYDPLYWGLVFPLGMYSVCTHQLLQVLHLSFLQWLPLAFAWIAIVAWGITFIGLLKQLPRIL